MLGKIGVSTIGVLLMAAPMYAAHSNEIRIGLNATVEERCTVADIRPVGMISPDQFRVQIVCNASRFRLGFVDDQGVVPVELMGANGMVGQVSNSAGSLSVSPTLPGIYEFQMRLADQNALRGNISIQLEGY